MKETKVRVRIRFPDWERTTVHRIHNFGEDLWRRFRDNNRVDIDLEEIDRAVGEISIRVRDSFLSKGLDEVRRLLKTHLMENEVVIDIQST